MRLPSTLTRVAKLLGKYHTLTMPICKQPTWLYDTMEKWLPVVLQRAEAGSDDTAHNRYLAAIRDMDLRTEYEEVKKIASSEPSPVVFCHNDLNRGNILLLSGDDEMKFIDFDYCSYNHRGFDIATYFNEWCSYRDPEVFPQYLEDYPAPGQQREFFTEYLRSSGVDQSKLAQEVASMAREVDLWGLIAHFFWGLWALNTVGRCTIDFPFIEFAMCRLQTYFKRKEELFGQV
ncbi:choline/ethanolamine kinase-like [Lingula anatina]|uniref:Choline/ethanolamine kinase-like n=1 Tax=Lingula anatina TaxID=7574 RepID=A0A1S3JYE3_LINAN|nr:choline/ethanolamine kinase-like [Lingula anatina]|eukprot:XP_013415418.1 choline/ethanolamine kinase-like [Lingula anatina]